MNDVNLAQTYTLPKVYNTTKKKLSPPHHIYKLLCFFFFKFLEMLQDLPSIQNHSLIHHSRHLI